MGLLYRGDCVKNYAPSSVAQWVPCAVKRNAPARRPNTSSRNGCRRHEVFPQRGEVRWKALDELPRYVTDLGKHCRPTSCRANVVPDSSNIVGMCPRRKDGLRLADAYVTAVARCLPSANRPTAAEMHNCQTYSHRELDLLSEVQIVLVLGQIAFNAYWRLRWERPDPGVGEGLSEDRGGRGGGGAARSRAPRAPATICPRRPTRRQSRPVISNTR